MMRAKYLRSFALIGLIALGIAFPKQAQSLLTTVSYLVRSIFDFRSQISLSCEGKTLAGRQESVTYTFKPVILESHWESKPELEENWDLVVDGKQKYPAIKIRGGDSIVRSDLAAAKISEDTISWTNVIEYNAYTDSDGTLNKESSVVRKIVINRVNGSFESSGYKVEFDSPNAARGQVTNLPTLSGTCTLHKKI